MKLGSRVQSALLGDQILSHYIAWCGTRKPTTSGCAVKDGCVLFDYKDKDEVTQATLPQRTGTKVAGVAAAAAADLELLLRQELQGLRLTALQKRAASEGVEQEVIEDATDSDQPKDNLIALVIQHVVASNAERDQAAEEETAAALEALRQDLEGMRLTALQRRAASEGVEETQIDNAMDGEDPKAGIVALILQHQ